MGRSRGSKTNLDLLPAVAPEGCQRTRQQEPNPASEKQPVATSKEECSQSKFMAGGVLSSPEVHLPRQRFVFPYDVGHCV